MKWKLWGAGLASIVILAVSVSQASVRQTNSRPGVQNQNQQVRFNTRDVNVAHSHGSMNEDCNLRSGQGRYAQTAVQRSAPRNHNPSTPGQSRRGTN